MDLFEFIKIISLLIYNVILSSYFAFIDSCAHKRTHKIMRESILNFGSFIATKCSSWINHEKKLCENETRTCAGENAKSDSRGMYFFHTNKMSPFALEANASEVYIVNMDFDEIN